MKALLIPVIALSTVSAAVAAPHHQAPAPPPAPAPAAPAYPLAATGTSVNIALETTVMNLDGQDAGGHQSFNGLRIGLERVIYKTPSHFVTVSGSVGYGVSHDNQADPIVNKDANNVQDQSIDYSLLTVNLGVDWNLKLGEQTYAYAGPRLGWAQYKWEPNAPNADGDDVSYIGYGVEIGLRYFVNSRCSVNASVRTMRYLEEDEVSPLTTSLGVGVNISF